MNTYGVGVQFVSYSIELVSAETQFQMKKSELGRYYMYKYGYDCLDDLTCRRVVNRFLYFQLEKCYVMP